MVTYRSGLTFEEPSWAGTITGRRGPERSQPLKKRRSRGPGRSWDFEGLICSCGTRPESPIWTIEGSYGQ